MSRETGLLPISANFEFNIASPSDARSVVATQADLITSFGVYAYRGMIVSVHSDSTPTNNGLYRLKSLPYTDLNNWEQLGTGGSTSSFIRDFIVSDWINAGGVYYIDFDHDLNQSRVSSEIFKGSNKVFVDTVIINSNRLRIQTQYDAIFDGSIKIT